MQKDVCPRCGGVFLDPGELDALDDSVWTNVEDLPMDLADPPELGTPGYRDPAAETAAACPRCARDEPMRMGRYAMRDNGSITLDRCDRCRGIWLDEGALDWIRTYVGELDTRLLTDIRWKPGASADNPEGQPKKPPPAR